MRALVAAGAFGSAVVAFALLLAIGLFLAGVEQTGARGAGVLLIACAAVAFGAFLFLVRARYAYFGGRLRRPLGVVVTLTAAAPVLALAWAALLFTGVPLETSVPMVDWPVFALGGGLALGGLCVLLLGYRRLWERPGRRQAGDAAALSRPRDNDEVPVRES